MRIYDGSMLHGCFRSDPNISAEVSTLDLGSIPEDVFKNDVMPLVTQLGSILNKYNVYIWGTSGYHESE